MKRFRSRRATGGLKVPEISGDHFSFMQSAFHGFPHKPTAISYEKDYRLLAIGTKNGELRVYGRPGLELKACYVEGAAIQKIYSFTNVHQFITVCSDNCVVLWHISMDSSSQEGPLLHATNSFNMNAEGGKTITACCLSQLTGHFYIGTSSGNVFTLDLRSFKLVEDLIFWDQATALIQPAAKTHSGPVKSLEICPDDHNKAVWRDQPGVTCVGLCNPTMGTHYAYTLYKLLIGYEKGMISLWDLERGLPSKNFPASINDSLPLECLSWQQDGRKFMSAHTDGAICTWSVSNSSPESGPVRHYGENCDFISNIKWLDSEQNPLLIFLGGLPQDHTGDHHAVTIMHGVEHVALDFSSPVVDMFPININDTEKGDALLVLCEEELLAFDLKTTNFPEIQKPYLHSIHSSPVTVVQVYDNCSRHLYEKILELCPTSLPSAGNAPKWPVMGGCIKTVEPPSYTLLITGHENGSVKFWDATSIGMSLIYELKTRILFVGMEEDTDAGQSEYSWPPYRSVGKFDPFGDDPRLAIHHIKFCQLTRTLCVGGAGGQVITFSLNTTQSNVRLETSRADIVKKNDKRYKWGGEGPLECRSDALNLSPGFQATFCMQCKPPAPINSLDFQPNWGIVAAGTCHGFAVGNFVLKTIVLTHCTIVEENEPGGNITRIQSLRRSFRNSFRRRRTGSLTVRSRNAVTEDRASAAEKKRRPRATSEPAASVTTDPTEGMPLSREQQGVVNSLLLAETYVTGSSQMEPCLFAATAGSMIIRYTLSIPPPQERFSQPATGQVMGKDYSLLHQAPIVALFVMDHVNLPLASLFEVDNQIVPPPAQGAPHYVVVVTEEQIKIVMLPSMKTKKKEKITDTVNQRIKKAFIIRVKAPGASPQSDRDWNPALLLLTNHGAVFVYSLPELKQCYRKTEFINPGDRKALRSAVVSCNGELFNLRSFSELQRCLFCTYNYSYHSTLAPNLFPFEGSTPGVKRSSSLKTAIKVDVENSPVQSPRRDMGVRLEPIAPSHSPTQKQSGNTTANAFGLETIKDEPEQPIQSISDKPEETPLVNTVTAEVEHNSPQEEEKETKTEEPESDGEKQETEEMRQAQAYLEAAGGQADPTGAHSIDITANKDLLASAQAFTKTTTLRRKPSSSSSSSSDSDSSSSSSSSNPSQSQPGMLINTDADMVVGNSGAGAFEFGDLETESSQLDEIIQSSLRQVENAREFYEEMQKRVILKSD